MMSPRFVHRCSSLVVAGLALSVVLASGLSAQEVNPAEIKQAEFLKKVATEAKGKQDAAETALKEAQKKSAELQAGQVRLKTEISRADKAHKDAEAKVKPEQEKVTKADAAKKAADQAAAAAKKAYDDLKAQLAAAEKKANEEAAKATAANKALTDAQTGLKTVQDAAAAMKKKLDESNNGLKATEKLIAEFKPQLDQTAFEFAVLKEDYINKQKAAEKALIGVGQLVSFSESVAPVFAKRCLACHNAKTAKGRYNMETFAGILKGGESGEAVVAGDTGSSPLFAMIEDGSMPKDADPLTAEEIASIRKWIETGAVLDAGFAASQPLIQVVPKVAQPNPPEAYPVPVPVTAVAFNQDASIVATSGYHEVVLWKAADGTILRRITNVAERVYDIEFTKDGSRIVIAAGTPAQIGEVKIFQVHDGKLLGDLVRTDDSVFGVALSPDETRLATCGADRSIRIFDFATLEELVLIEDHADWVMDVAWAPDGSKLASASRDKTSKVFDAKSGDSLVTFNGHGQPVYGVGFSPDGKLVVTSGSDRNIRTWNVGDAKQVRAIGGFGNEVFRIVVTPDGRVFSCSADKNARSHQIGDGKALQTFGGHSDWVYSVAVHPEAKRVVAGSYNGEVRIWNLDDAKELVKFVAAPGMNKPQATAAK